MAVIQQNRNISTDLISLEASLFEAIEREDENRMLHLLDRIIKAAVENDMILEWVKNIIAAQNIELGESISKWMALRYEYYQDMIE